jgi:hypothetical protein
MAETRKRNPLLPWIIGLVIVVAVNVYIAYLFFSNVCTAPALAQFVILIILPAVYLVLMYLTLKSSEDQ